jgi:hypothetical protein
LFSQMLTALTEEPPASAGYRGSDLVLWPKVALPDPFRQFGAPF